MTLNTLQPMSGYEGLYGPSHWVHETGLYELLSPYMCLPALSDEFARFDMIGSQVATELLSLLPKANLEESQNSGPQVCDLLQACANNLGVYLSGYVVCAPRFDERISIDGIYLPSTSDCSAQAPYARSLALCWPILREKYGLTSAQGDPDEFLLVPTDCQLRNGWWIWWD